MGMHSIYTVKAPNKIPDLIFIFTQLFDYLYSKATLVQVFGEALYFQQFPLFPVPASVSSGSSEVCYEISAMSK